MFGKITTLMIIVPVAVFAIIFIVVTATYPYGGETKVTSKSESEKYTQSQVISIVQSKSYLYSGGTITGEPSKLWSAEYDGDGFWFVTGAMYDSYEPTLYKGDITPRKYLVWWFNERTGEISREWLVTPQELVDRRGDLPSYDKGGLLPRWDK